MKPKFTLFYFSILWFSTRTVFGQLPGIDPPKGYQTIGLPVGGPSTPQPMPPSTPQPMPPSMPPQEPMPPPEPMPPQSPPSEPMPPMGGDAKTSSRQTIPDPMPQKEIPKGEPMPMPSPQEPLPTAPSEPSTPSPKEPSTPSPKEPSTPAPSEPSTPAPKEPSTPAPSEPSAPKEPSTPAPSKEPSTPSPSQEPSSPEGSPPTQPPPSPRQTVERTPKVKCRRIGRAPSPVDQTDASSPVNRGVLKGGGSGIGPLDPGDIILTDGQGKVIIEKGAGGIGTDRIVIGGGRGTVLGPNDPIPSFPPSTGGGSPTTRQTVGGSVEQLPTGTEQQQLPIGAGQLPIGAGLPIGGGQIPIGQLPIGVLGGGQLPIILNRQTVIPTTTGGPLLGPNGRILGIARAGSAREIQQVSSQQAQSLSDNQNIALPPAKSVTGRGNEDSKRAARDAQAVKDQMVRFFLDNAGPSDTVQLSFRKTS